MQDPYSTLQEIGERSQRLAANTDKPSGLIFSEAQKLLTQLSEVKSDFPALPPEWEQFVSGVEADLHHIQAESRRKSDKNQAGQIFIPPRAEHNRDQTERQENSRRIKRERKEKLKLLSLTATPAICIIALLGAIAVYQWAMLNSDEVWFHDLSKKRWGIIEKRISFGKSIETKDHNGMTGFLHLARTGTLQDLKKMQELGANVKALDHKGRSALHHAAANSNRSAVEWLITQGIDVNQPDHDGTTPLHYFFQKATGTSFSLDTYNSLLEHGARVDTSNNEESLLMAAVLWVRGGAFGERPADILQELIDRGADVNYQGKHGSTALNNALVRYLPENPNPAAVAVNDPVVRILLDAGAVYQKDGLLLSGEMDQPLDDRLEFMPGLR